MIHSASTTHSQMMETELLASSITPLTIHHSIGNEHLADSLADPEECLKDAQRMMIDDAEREGKFKLDFGQHERVTC